MQSHKRREVVYQGVFIKSWRKVKRERVKRGISQLALAQILGHKSPNYIAKIETRKHGVCYNLHHLFIIATEFDMDLRDLVPNTKEAK